MDFNGKRRALSNLNKLLYFVTISVYVIFKIIFLEKIVFPFVILAVILFYCTVIVVIEKIRLNTSLCPNELWSKWNRRKNQGSWKLSKNLGAKVILNKRKIFFCRHQEGPLCKDFNIIFIFLWFFTIFMKIFEMNSLIS